MCAAPKAPKPPPLPPLPELPPPPPPPPPPPGLPVWMLNPQVGAQIIRKTDDQRTAPKRASKGPAALRIPLAGSS